MQLVKKINSSNEVHLVV